MRITQSMMTRNYLKSMNKSLEGLTKAQQRISSNRKFTRGSENVSDAARALKVREQLGESQQYLVNIRDVENEMSSAESNLMSIEDILQTAQEKVLKGMDGTHQKERQIIAEELDSLKEQVLQFTNAKFADRYLFGGTKNDTAPYSLDSSGNVLYNGVKVEDIKQEADGSLYYLDQNGDKQEIPQNEDAYLDIGLGMRMYGSQVDPKTGFKISYSGIDILGYGMREEKNEDTGKSMMLPDNLYSILDGLAKEFKKPDDEYDGDKVGLMLNRLQERTDTFMLNVTELGARSKFLEKTTERVENDIFNLQKAQQGLEVTDDPAETINWKMYQYSWLATLQMGSKIIPQSLMDFLR